MHKLIFSCNYSGTYIKYENAAFIHSHRKVINREMEKDGRKACWRKVQVVFPPVMWYLFRFSTGMTFRAAAPLFTAYYGRCLIAHVPTFFLHVLRNPGLSCANIARTICAVGDADREKEVEEIRVVKPSVPASETMSQIQDSGLHTRIVARNGAKRDWSPK